MTDLVDALAIEARQIFGEVDVRVEPIDPHLRIHSVTGGVFRVRAGERSAVVKVIQHTGESTPDGLWGGDLDVSGRNYWKREWIAFASGLLAELPGRLRAPRALLTTEQSETECRVWMAEVAGRTGARLVDDDYTAAAYALGTTQGAYASGKFALPSAPWLARRWLRGWVEACAPFVAGDPPDPRVHQLWAARDELLAIVDSAPQTVVHCDFWPANLIVAGEVTAIDWSQIGIGAVAQDIDQLALDPVWMQARPGGSLDRLEELVLPAYAEGLRAAGLDVTDSELRRWYAAAAGVHYSWLGGRLGLHTFDERASIEARFGRSYDDVVNDRRRVVARALELGEWALAAA